MPFLLLEKALAEGEAKEDYCHCGNEKIIGTEDDKAYNRHAGADYCRQMIFRFAPLVDNDGDKQSGHGKVYPCGIEGYYAAEKRADETARYPVKMIEEGYGKIIAFRA